MRGYVSFIVRHRRAAWLVLVLTMLLSAWSARHIGLRFQYRDFYSYAGNPALETYDRFHRTFEDPAGYVVVLIHARDVFAPEVLRYVGQLTDALGPMPEFSKVRSLSNIELIRGSPEGVATGPVLGTEPLTDEGLRAVKRAALDSEWLRRRVVSSNGKYAAVLAHMRVPAEHSTVREQEQALAAASSVVERTPTPPSVEVSITGAPRVEVATTSSLLSDQLVLTPAVLTVVMALLLLIFRSWHGVLLPMVSVSIALAWTFGLFAQTPRPLIDIIGSIAPITLLVYGLVDPVFVLSRYLALRTQGLEREAAVVETIAQLWVPCLLTSVSTALGFAVFVFAELPTIVYYGGVVGAGVLLTWVSTITVLPLLMITVPDPKDLTSSARAVRWAEERAARLWRVLAPRSGRTVVVAAAALLLGGYWAREQHISNEYVGSLPRGEARDQVRLLERELAGVVRTVVFLEGEPDVMRRPDVLRAMEKVDAYLQQQPSVTNVASLADVVADANQAFHDGEPAARKVPESETLIAQYLALADPVQRAELVTDDYSKAFVAALSVDNGSEAARGFRKELAAFVQAAFSGMPVRASLTGNGVVAWTALDSIVIEVLKGFVIAFGIVVALIWLVYRSLRLALLVVLPNVLPVAACFVVIRLLGLSLRLDNAIVLCVALGGLFNTTIQLVSQVPRLAHANPGLDRGAIIELGLREVAAAASFTSIILVAGFSVLLLSSFSGLQALGGLSMITIAVAFVSDMCITPCLFFKWLPSDKLRPVSETPVVQPAPSA